MFFAAKTKGFVLDRGEQTTLLARTSSLQPPLVLEDIREFSTGDEAGLTEALVALLPQKKLGLCAGALRHQSRHTFRAPGDAGSETG